MKPCVVYLGVVRDFERSLKYCMRRRIKQVIYRQLSIAVYISYSDSYIEGQSVLKL